MVVSEQLKKQIFIETIALLFLFGVILYTFFAISKNNKNNVTSQDGMVIVLDDSKFTGMFKCSDGEGLEKDGITYTLTNNNLVKVRYKVIVIPSIKDEDILSMIRVSIDDLYIESLVDLEKKEDGYVLMEDTLGAGFTDINLFKFWYKLKAKDELIDKKISYKFKLVLEENVDDN